MKLAPNYFYFWFTVSLFMLQMILVESIQLWLAPWWALMLWWCARGVAEENKKEEEKHAATPKTT